MGCPAAKHRVDTMLPLDVIGSVRWPCFTGDHWFAILGQGGYERSVLAPSKASFLAAAERVVIHQGMGTVLYAPIRLRVVAFDPRWRALLRSRHQSAVERHYAARVSMEAQDWRDHFRTPPPGFRVTSRRKLVWADSRPMSEVFARKVDSPIVPTEASFSHAATSPSLRETWALGVDGWHNRVAPFPLRDMERLLDHMPLFYYVQTELLPDLLAPVLERAAIARRETEAARATMEATRVQRREEETRERLLAFFAAP